MIDVCNEKHKRIDETLDRYDIRLNNHGDRIDNLERYQSKTEVEIKNLIEQIKVLVITIKWAMGLTFTTLLGFFIWYVQNLR